MDLSDPTRAVTPTLDGPVLAALASAGRPLTISDVAAQSVRGSEIGIRRSVNRLVEQGIVRATLMGRNSVYALNRDHIAAQVAVLLSGLRLELWRRFRSELAEWVVKPLLASVFGSAGRGDGDAGSDIDILLVPPPLLGQVPLTPAQMERLLKEGVSSSLLSSMANPRQFGEPDRWQDQVDRLRDLVQQWTGNPLQVIELPFQDWWQPRPGLVPLLHEIKVDAVELLRDPRLPSDLSAGGPRA
jgi:predicted nucleotidyltransferase